MSNPTGLYPHLLQQTYPVISEVDLSPTKEEETDAQYHQRIAIARSSLLVDAQTAKASKEAFQAAYEQAIQHTKDMSVEQAKFLLWPELGHQAKKQRRFIAFSESHPSPTWP